MTFSSFTSNEGPVYESPVIVKSNGLTGKTASFSLSATQRRAMLGKGNDAAQKQAIRNELIREFNLAGLEKWVNHLAKENINGLSNSAEIANLNEIRTMSISMQKYIHATCSKISSYLKVLDLKLKEIRIVDDKIKGLFTKTNFKKALTGVKAKTAKLKKAMSKEKVVVKRVMQGIQQKQKKLLKVLSVYDSKFTAKNQSKLQDLLTSINLQLRPQMSLPYFKKAYGIFISAFLTKSKNLSQKQLVNYQQTASDLIKQDWGKALEKAKKEWLKSKGNTKKAKRKGKKSRKNTKTVVRRIK